MNIRNPILATDSYKFSHFMQYPADARFVTSYIEARGSKIPGVKETVFAGLQVFIKDFLMRQLTMKDVNEAAEFCAKHGVPFNRKGWERVVTVHNGYLPVRIVAVPEGSVIPLRNVLAQVENLDPELPWLTSYIETLMLSYVWYASSVATVSREIKKVIKKALDDTSDAPDAELPFKLHDFGYRGAAAGAAGLGGMAHLINFMGTDTVAGIETAMEYYNADVCGYSISASEHSTMTSWGQEYEFQAYKNMVESYAKEGAIFACVIDSYDTINAIRLWAEVQPGETLSLLDQVKAAGATVVLRPDSGDAVQMPIEVIKEIGKYTGYTVNSKGYKVLPDHVRVIQGDGIDIADVTEILSRMTAAWGLSASNIAFGMGGGLLQKVNRDTFKFAMKANQLTKADGSVVDVVKDPVTDHGKKSKAGAQILLRSRKSGEFITMKQSEANKFVGEFQNEQYDSVMRVVYEAGFGYVKTKNYTFDEVRANAAL